MGAFSRVVRVCRNLFNRDRFERELDEELLSTLDALVDEGIANGLSPQHARQAALRELRIEPIKEHVRDSRTGAGMETLYQDLRYAWRHIRRSPWFAITAVVTLALGIGANAAIVSMLKALTWQPIAIGDPTGLIAIAPRDSRGLDRSTPVDAIAHLEDGPLTSLCGYLGGVVQPVVVAGNSIQASTTFITSRCLDAFRIRPILGRGLTDQEAPLHSRGAPVALISHRLWQGTFNGRSDILGQRLSVNDVELSIVGVLPRGFVGIEVDHGVDIFTPFDTVIPASPARRQLAAFILGRLRPGVSLATAEAELRTRWPKVLDAVLPGTLPPSELANFRDSTLHLEQMSTGRSLVRQRYGRALSLTFSLTGLLLLLACVNLGALLLARLTGRAGELSVRLALGGSRWRVSRQMLLESVMLALGGSVFAVPVAYGLVSTLVSMLPTTNLPNTMAFAPDLTVLLVMGAAAIGVGLMMSALPLWVSMRRHGVSHTAWDRTIAGANNRWGRALLIVQVAVSVVLVIGASLLTRSLYLLQHNDFGVRSEGIVTVRTLPLPGATNQKRNSLTDFGVYIERISALPGVESVAFARGFPRGASLAPRPVQFVGEDASGATTSSDYVSTRFFDLLGIPLITGRLFSEADEVSNEPVAVVSESLARALSPGGNVVGRRIKFGPIPGDQNRLIIGVVGNATQGNPRLVTPEMVYRPLQLTANSPLSGNLLIATRDAASVRSGVTDILRDVNRDYALEIIGLDRLFARAPASERMSASVAATAGVLALLLAVLGVHATLAYDVHRRSREIGVRLAIGATPQMIGRAILRDGLRLTMIGVAIGLPLAAFAARLLRSLMFGVTPSDLGTFATVGIVVVLIGALAGLRSASRAARTDPMTALRSG